MLVHHDRSSIVTSAHPSLVSDRYPNKYKCDALGGLVITRIDVIRVTRREQLRIFMEHEDFGDHELHCVQKWVRFIIEGSESHTL